MKVIERAEMDYTIDKEKSLRTTKLFATGKQITKLTRHAGVSALEVATFFLWFLNILSI
jgi:hypothetical protein